MRPSFFAMPLVAALAACSGPAVPTLDATDLVSQQRSRDIIMKGITHGGQPPYIVKLTYTMNCANDNQGGTPSQRADRAIAAAPQIVGQVYPAMGAGNLNVNERSDLNRVFVPQMRCQVMRIDHERIAAGHEASMRVAIRLGALNELIKER